MQTTCILSVEFSIMGYYPVFPTGSRKWKQISLTPVLRNTRTWPQITPSETISISPRTSLEDDVFHFQPFSVVLRPHFYNAPV